MKIKLLIVSLLLLYIDVYPQNTDKYTLDYCIEKALEGNHNIKSAELDMLSAKSKASSVKTERLPTLDFSGNYSRLSEIDPFSIMLPTQETIDIFPMIFNNYGLNLSIKQPLFTAHKLKYRYDIAENIYMAKESNLEETRNNVKYSVEDYFWRLVYGIESGKVVDESIPYLKAGLQLS